MQFERWRSERLTGNATAKQPHDSDLLRRLNPKHTSEHLNALIGLAPDLTEDLLSSVDQPLTIRRCRQSGRDYLLCDYNRDGDSYRSPWSNQFDPPLDSQQTPAAGGEGGDDAISGSVPTDKVRKMEVKANEAFDVYRELYYEGGVSSVYFWQLDDGFAGVVLLKKGESFAFLLYNLSFYPSIARIAPHMAWAVSTRLRLPSIVEPQAKKTRAGTGKLPVAPPWV